MVSPLLALMRDQLDRLPHGLPGAMLWGGQTRSEADAVIADAARGALKLLYVAPEKLLTPVVLQALLRLPQGIGLVSGCAGRGAWGKGEAREKLLTPVVLQALLRLPQGIGLVGA